MSYRSRSGRPLLPAAAALLVSLFGASAFAQGIEAVRIASSPGGGSTSLPVWIIGDDIVVDVRYSADLPETAAGTLKIELDEVGDGRGPTREAACSVDASAPDTLACTYTIREGDAGTGVSVQARAGILRGSALPGTVFAETDVTGSPHDVDGVRLALQAGGVTVRLLDADGLDLGGSRDGARAGETVEVTMAFADGEEPAYSPGFGAALVIGGAERAMAYVERRDGRLTFRYEVVAGDNDPEFTLALSGADRLTDRNGNEGLAAGEDVNAKFLPGSPRRVDTQGPRIVGLGIEGRPESGAYVADSDIEGADTDIALVLEFDEDVVAAPGAVSLDVLVGPGSGGASQSAACVGSGGRQLTCTLDVAPGWNDADGVATPANPLAFGAGDLIDDLGNAAVNLVAPKRFGDHRIDTTPPLVTDVRVRVLPQHRAVAGHTIDVMVTLSEEIRAVVPPSLELVLGGSHRPFEYVRSAGRALEFRYTLTASDVAGTPGDLIPLALGTLSAGSAAVPGIVDAHGNGIMYPTDIAYPRPAVRELVVLEQQQRADTVFRGVERAFLISPPKSGRYGLAQGNNMIAVGVSFFEAASFGGNVSLVLTIGGHEREVQPLGNQGVDDALWEFLYDVRAGDAGPVGISALKLGPGATVLDDAGNGYENSPNPTHPAVQMASIPLRLTPPSAQVDTAAPSVAGVRFLPMPAPSATGPDGRPYYGVGEKIRFEIEMSEDVQVHESGTVHVDVGGRSVRAAYVELAGSRRLTYEYVVLGDHLDRNGIAVEPIAAGATGAPVVRDLAGNPAPFVLAGTSSAAHRVDGSLEPGEDAAPPPEPDPQAPPRPIEAIKDVAVRSDTPASGYHRAGDRIVIEVTFEPPVSFTAAPQLRFGFDEGGEGCDRVDADLATGTAVRVLTFTCTVVDGDEDRDGIEVDLVGSFTTADGDPVTTAGFGLADAPRIDAKAPRLETVELTSTGAYVAGDPIEVTATFSEPVAAEGAPAVPLTVGDSTRQAALHAPASGRAQRFVFRYAVVAGDEDDDGVTVPALTDGSLGADAAFVDVAGNAAVMAHAPVDGGAGHIVDTTPPRIIGIAIAGDARTWREGDTISFEVTFSEDVVVAATPTPSLAMTVGGAGRELRLAAPVNGADASVLTFAYTVRAGDTGAIGVPNNALTAAVSDAVGNAAELASGAFRFPGHGADASAPQVTSVGIVSEPRAGRTYIVGETIEVEVRFDEVVEVTPSPTGPHLLLIVGSEERPALYAAGGGTEALRFAYVVQPGDRDEDGVSVRQDAVRLTDGALIADASGLPAAVEHAGLPSDDSHRVDGVAPAVTDVAITSRPAAGDAYLIGETIEVTVSFGEAIVIQEVPRLRLEVGDATPAVACRAGVPMSLVCAYKVAAGDFDADGVSLPADALQGKITDLPGNPAQLAHGALPDDPGHKVHAAPPVVDVAIPAMRLTAGGDVETVDLGSVFGGVRIGYDATTSSPDVASVTLGGSRLTVRSGREGSASVTVTATNPAGSVSLTFMVDVTTDPVETAVLNEALAAVGRGILSGTATVIGSRLELMPGRGAPASLTLGGRRLASAARPADFERRHGADAIDPWAAPADRDPAHHGATHRLLGGSGFSMPLQASGGGASFAVWGAGDLRRFEGAPDGGEYDGSAMSAHLGVDARGRAWLAGVSVSRSGAEVDYGFGGDVDGGGTLETSMTGVHPYGRVDLGDATELWVMAGFGSGEAELRRSHIGDGVEVGDLSMSMVIGGIKRALGLEIGGAELSLKGDAGFVSLEVADGSGALDGLSVGVSRLRVGLEAAWSVAGVQPFAEVSGRFDGGDGQTGGGAEVAAGVRMHSAATGLGIEAKGRLLARHDVAGYRESGVSAVVSYEPGKAGRGISLRLSPRWGGSADATDLFWDETGRAGAPGARGALELHEAATWGVDASVGYGYAARLSGLVTPFGQVDVAGSDRRRVRVGVRYGVDEGLRGGTQLEVSVERLAGGVQPSAQVRTMVRAEARF